MTILSLEESVVAQDNPPSPASYEKLWLVAFEYTLIHSATGEPSTVILLFS